MRRRVWIWMLATAVTAGGAGLGACKRQGPGSNAPSVVGAPRLAGPTPEEMAKEKRQEALEDLYSFVPLGTGSQATATGFKTADGELWSRYANGVMIQELRRSNEGQPPRAGQTVKVAYTGIFPETGKVFDHKDAADPLVFVMGSKKLIEGFSVGISNLRVGGKRRVYVPADLAYGEAGRPAGGIPGGQALIFEMELLSITGAAVEMTPEDLPKLEPLGPPAPATMP